MIIAATELSYGGNDDADSPRMNDAGEVEMMTEEMIGSDPRSRRRLREMKISSFQQKKM